MAAGESAAAVFDDWLNVDEETVDAIIQSRSSAAALTQDGTATERTTDTVGPNSEETEAIESQTDRLRKMAEKVGKFVEGKGGVEGALFEE